MPEVGPFGKPLLVSIPPSMEFSGPPSILATLIRLLAPTPLSPPLMLATISVSQLMDRLMKRAKVAVGDGKLVAQVQFSLVDLAKPPLKMLVVLVEGLIPESCPDRQLWAK